MKIKSKKVQWLLVGCLLLALLWPVGAWANTAGDEFVAGDAQILDEAVLTEDTEAIEVDAATFEGAEPENAVEDEELVVEEPQQTEYTVSTLAELKEYAAIQEVEGLTVHLAGDLIVDEDTRTSATISTYGNLTIDGHGYALDGNDMEGFFYVRGGELTLKNMTVKNAKESRGTSGNAIAGSAVYARSGNVVLENCTFINNTSSNGTVYIGGNRSVSMSNCTFAGNTANNGGAVYLSAGSTGYIANSIMVGSNNSDVYFALGTNPPTVVDGGYNLIGTIVLSGEGTVDTFSSETTVVDENFANYSGWLTDTANFQYAEQGLPLLQTSDSPALDKISADNSYLPAQDQRGVSRPQNEQGDIGAYEVIPYAEQVEINSQDYVIIKRNQTLSLTATVSPIAAPQEVTWTSSNSSVATVTADGLVSSHIAGSAVITAQAENGRSDNIVVRVMP